MKIVQDSPNKSAPLDRRDRLMDKLVYTLNHPIQETHERVYHVSGFKPLTMYRILFGEGLKWISFFGIYYNTAEYGVLKIDDSQKRYNIAHLHAMRMYHTKTVKVRKFFSIRFRTSTFAYLTRFGIIPLIVTYEIDTKGFEDDRVHQDDLYKFPLQDENGTSLFRFVMQKRIPSQYIRLKTLTFMLPMFKYSKVIWRRK